MFHDFTVDPGKTPETVIIKGSCIRTSKPVEMEISRKGYDAYYEQGVYIQKAFPELSRKQREYLVSGLSPEGWDLIFPPREPNDLS